MRRIQFISFILILSLYLYCGDAQGCGHGDSYKEILEDLHARFGVSKRQARDRLAALKLKPGQSIYSQATEVTRLVEVAFPTLADADRRAMALEHFTRAWESKNIQRHLLAVAPPPPPSKQRYSL